MRNGTMIFPPDDSEPEQGFFEIVIRRGCRPRALGIICNQGLWNVYVDGQPHSEPSMNWREAFGKLYQNIMLNGRRLDVAEYKRLILARTEDIFAGIDLEKPIDHNSTKVAI